MAQPQPSTLPRTSIIGAMTIADRLAGIANPVDFRRTPVTEAPAPGRRS